jgi:hypothetical protein
MVFERQTTFPFFRNSHLNTLTATFATHPVHHLLSTMDIPPPAALRKIAREVHAMVNDPPEGIRMILGEDMSDIQAWIQGPG